ncbi:hypothetical protein DFH09DRAFT_1376180, partial [Mycena vulgaris]
MREPLTQMQLEQDALVQPQTPPRVHPCARDDVPMVNGSSTVVSGFDAHTRPAPALVFTSVPSGRSLRDMQPL